MSAEAPRRGGRGRPLERARDLGRVGAVGARGARPRALRDDARSRSTAAATGSSESQATDCCQAPISETLPVLADSSPAQVLGSRRRRHPGPARPVRRGRHRPGPARARRRALRRRRRRRLGALHGQGSLQGGAARPRDPGRPQRDAAARRPDREPVRLPRLRQAGAGWARPSASRRRTTRPSWRRRSRSRGDTTRRCSSRSSSAGRRSSAACSGTSTRLPWRRSSARSFRTASGTTTRPSTTRAARTSSSPRGSRTRRPRACRPWRSTRSSRPSARGWPASTSSCVRTARSS